MKKNQHGSKLTQLDESKFFEEDLISKNTNEIKIIENYKKKLRIKKLEFYKND